MRTRHSDDLEDILLSENRSHYDEFDWQDGQFPPASAGRLGPGNFDVPIYSPRKQRQTAPDVLEGTRAGLARYWGALARMKRKIGRRSAAASDAADYGDTPNDVFQQPSRGLLGEALSRPMGVASLIGVLVAGITFTVNHAFIGLNKLDDYALVAFFVAGAILLSVVLRAGEPRPVDRPRPRQVRPSRRELEVDFGYEAEAESDHASASLHDRHEMHDRQGRHERIVEDVPIVADEETLALEGYQKALLHYQQQGDARGQGEILRRLGHWAKSKGHLKESRDFYINARLCFQGLDDNYAEAAVLLDLGQVLESLGDQDAAGAAYREANRALLDVAMDTGDRSQPPSEFDQH